MKDAVSQAKLAADSYNRYATSVQNAFPDVYRVLQKAQIVEEFATLLDITTRLPGNAMAAMEHMRPLECLGDESNHTTLRPGLTDLEVQVVEHCTLPVMRKNNGAKTREKPSNTKLSDCHTRNLGLLR